MCYLIVLLLASGPTEYYCDKVTPFRNCYNVQRSIIVDHLKIGHCPYERTYIKHVNCNIVKDK